MSAALVIDLRDLPLVQQRLDRLARPALRQAVLETAGALLESRARDRIQQGGPGPDGAPWPALSERWRHRKRRLVGAQGLLQFRGDLRDSLTYEVEGDQVRIGSNLVYAGGHQFGDAGTDARGRPRNLPARPYLGLSDQDGDELQQAIGELLQAELA